MELARRQDHFQIGGPGHHDLSEDDVVALGRGPSESKSEAMRAEALAHKLQQLPCEGLGKDLGALGRA